MSESDTDKLTDVARLLADYEKSPSKVDEFLEAKFTLYSYYREKRQVCQFIFLTVLRNKFIIDFLLKNLLLRKTKPLLLALLQCGAAEIIVSPHQKRPQIIHAWVEACKNDLSQGESKVINAVLRRFAGAYDGFLQKAQSFSDFALLYSHPKWLAKAWADEFGKEKAIEIMRSNQRPSEVFFRVSSGPSAAIAFAPFIDFFEKTKYPQFFKLKSGHWHDAAPLLSTPYVYIQDPTTSLAPMLLDPKPNEEILDLCASPGGKSRIIADLLLASGANLSRNLLAASDLAGPRFERLNENLSKIDFLPVKSFACNLLEEDIKQKLSENNLPIQYDAIFLDAPCSNTGVLRRRPDVRYRIKKSDIANCEKIQISMIKTAITLLKPNGRLVYSTCSIERAENVCAPEEALKDFPEFKIESAQTILPDDGDGGGFCLIRRS